MSKNSWLWVRDIAIAVVIIIVVMQFIKPTVVRGQSMENTLYPKDYLVLSKQAYNFGNDPKRGDIVVFRSTSGGVEKGSHRNIIKRVIASGGDKVEIRDGMVYVNGEALDEPYTRDGYTGGVMDEVAVPEGTYFLLGDNRQWSKDSRDPSEGFISRDKLVGKAVLRVWPIDSFGAVN
jgi:signal peptidase I